MQPAPSANQQEEKKAHLLNTLQGDIEKLQAIDSDLAKLLEEEIRQAILLNERTQDLLKETSSEQLTELRSMAKPLGGVVDVFRAVMYLLAGATSNSLVSTDENRHPIDLTWNGCREVMRNPEEYLSQLKKVGECIDEEKITYEMTVPVRGYLEKEELSNKNLQKVSASATVLGNWLRGMIEYFDKVRDVKAKIRARLEKDE